jgi:hypothetical protein
MAQYWIDVEDDPDIIDADIDEALNILENVELIPGHDLEVLENVNSSWVMTQRTKMMLESPMISWLLTTQKSYRL